uniref:Matrix extracellular phosphoglycoprotein n=1 Tax=Pogona vitticeps TaxID=103695 RepID=A0ABM5GL67_9SAUR
MEELQPHYQKAKQKCVGEHQIMVKGRHSKHGFYIFNYVYSSSMPNNQTQIQKEDNKKTISSATDELDKKHKPKKPSDNLTDAAQETSGGQKHLTGRGDSRKPEDRTNSGRRQNVRERHGNMSNWDFQQHHLELISGKGENDFAGGDNTNEIDGSGDIDFPGHVATHHGIDVGSEASELSKDHQVTRSPERGKFEGKGKGGKPIITKPSKNGITKIWIKENEVGESQETRPYNDIPRKIKEPQSKDYSEVSLKGKTNSTNEEPGREVGGHLGLSGKQANVTVELHSFKVQSNVSRDLLGKEVLVIDKSNFTSTSDTGQVKIASEKGNRKATAQKKGEYEPTVIVTKWKDRSGVTRPLPKSEARGGSHVEVASTIKPHKKDNAREDVVTGMSSSNMEATGISKKHKKDKDETGAEEFISQVEDPIFTKPGKRKPTEATSVSKIRKKEKGEVDNIEKLVSQVKDSVFTKPDKTNQSGIILSGKLKGHMDGAGVTESYSEGEAMTHKRISGSQVSASNAILQGRKDVSIPHRKSNTGQEDLSSTKAHQKEVAGHEKINTKPQESSLGDPVTHEREKKRFGSTFQEVSKDTTKGSINYEKAIGAATELKSSDNVESSDRKTEQQQGQHSVQLNGALSLSPGSEKDVQHLFKLPKNENVKSQEHSLPSVKIVEKVVKLSRGTAKAHTGKYRDKIAKRYQKYSGVSRRKSSQHAKKHPSLKKAHGSDSSQSSESKEKRGSDSRQSFEDYQNDHIDSRPSAESAENLSPESNQSDDQSNMED